MRDNDDTPVVKDDVKSCFVVSATFSFFELEELLPSPADTTYIGYASLLKLTSKPISGVSHEFGNKTGKMLQLKRKRYLSEWDINKISRIYANWKEDCSEHDLFGPYLAGLLAQDEMVMEPNKGTLTAVAGALKRCLKLGPMATDSHSKEDYEISYKEVFKMAMPYGTIPSAKLALSTDVRRKASKSLNPREDRDRLFG